MMSTKQFRMLLVFYFVSLIAFFTVDFIPGVYPALLDELKAHLPDPEFFGMPWLLFGVGVPLVFASLLGLVGLFLLKPWGRFISLYSTLISFFLYPVLGATVSSGSQAALAEISAILWGAVLACAYFSPVSAQFSKNRSVEGGI